LGKHENFFGKTLEKSSEDLEKNWKNLWGNHHYDSCISKPITLGKLKKLSKNIGGKSLQPSTNLCYNLGKS
jgi:hypothetical protein